MEPTDSTRETSLVAIDESAPANGHPVETFLRDTVPACETQGRDYHGAPLEVPVSPIDVIVPERRNRPMAVMSLVGAFLLAAFLGVVVSEAAPGERWSPGALLLATFGWGAVFFLGVQARFFLKPRGGVVVDRGAGCLRLSTMGGAVHDVVVPLSQVVRVALSPRWERVRRGERVIFSLEVERSRDVAVVIGEHESHDAAAELGQALADHLGRPFEDSEFFRGRVPAPRVGYATPEVSLGTRWHLFGPVTSLGTLVFVLGAFLFTTADRSFFFGVLVAPFLLLMGGLLLLTSVLLTWGRQTIAVEAGDEGDRLLHRVRLGGRSFFEATINEAGKLRVRVFPSGARGTGLEVVAPTRVLALGNGLNGATRTPVSAADGLARDLHAALFADDGFEPAPPPPADEATP